MSEIYFDITGKNLSRVLKNEVRNKKYRKGVVHPSINPSPMKKFFGIIHAKMHISYILDSCNKSNNLTEGFK